MIELTVLSIILLYVKVSFQIFLTIKLGLYYLKEKNEHRSNY